jgi:hypothetical protein
METTIIVYGNTLSATDYQRVCDAWRQARQPITVQFIFPSSAHIVFEQDETIVDGTLTALPLAGEEIQLA